MTIYRGPGGGGSSTTDSELSDLTAIAQEAAGYRGEAAASATAAASSATDAATSATEAASSATAAASSASAASTSASNASTSASNASTSASNAATSETNAANSATEAAASAASINDTNLVHKTGEETIGGTKTFSSTISGNVSGTASNVTGTVAVANGGTGATTAAAAPFALKGANSDITSLTALASVNGGQLAGIRNKIINGNFGINQRNASSASTAYAAGAYVMDRWKAGSGGCTLSFATTENVTTVTITAGTLVQVIEGNNLQSGTHILSWTGTAQGRIDSGSYGASGVTGTAIGGAVMSVEFGTGTVSLVQLEKGSVATPFEHRPYGMELALCQRYYETGGVKSGLTGGTTNVTIVFKTVKRSTPTMAYGTSPQGAGTSLPTGADWTSTSEVAVYASATTINCSWTASAEL